MIYSHIPETSNLRGLRYQFVIFCAAMTLLISDVESSDSADEPNRFAIEVKSSLDDTTQPSYVILPGNYESDEDARPLLVSLHTWSGDLHQRNETLEAAANDEGWIYLFPNFRGVNDDPAACGSELAQRDILDAVDHCLKAYRVDRSRIYLTGVSGGGHMTLLMAGRYPDRWAAASAWVGISDLSAWHELHSARGSRYAEMMEACCSGKPGDSDETARRYRERSPLTYLTDAGDLPLDIAAGIHDGHEGSVPIRHSLDAFNAVAASNGMSTINESEIMELSQKNGRLKEPQPSDQVSDEALGRDIHLRRQSGQCRVTIFEGGHEGITSAAVDWLKRHRRKSN